MKCIEDPNIMSVYNNMEINKFEIWWCNTSKKATSTDGVAKYKSELKQHPAYNYLSPFNFFRENLVFEMGSHHTLEHISLDLLNKKLQFIDKASLP